MSQEIPQNGGPLQSRTWDVDRDEGQRVQHLKDTSLEPLAEPLIEVPDDIKGNLVVTSVDALINWSRKSALWPVSFGLACCAFEMIATAMGRFDIARFGMEAFRASPRQADLMIVAGTVTWKMSPAIHRIYEQMADPKWVIAMGVWRHQRRPVLWFLQRGARCGSHCSGGRLRPRLSATARRTSLRHHGTPRKNQEIPQYRENGPKAPIRYAGQPHASTGCHTRARPIMAILELTGQELASRVAAGVPGSVDRWDRGNLWVNPPRLADVARFMRDEPTLDFQFLNSISAVDFIDHIELVYHLTSFNHRHTAVVKTKLYGREGLSLPSVYDVWRGADFQEREVWDLMGVHFPGHPNMKRIMLWEGFEGHPLRKDYL